MMAAPVSNSDVLKPYFCGVGLDRLAGERDKEDAMKALLEDPRAECIVVDSDTGSRVLLAPTTVSQHGQKRQLARLPLRDVEKRCEPGSVAFLGLDKATRAPLFAALCGAGKCAGLGDFADVLGAASSGALDNSADSAPLAAYSKLMVRQHGRRGMRFCPCCGTATVARAAGTKRHCPRCATDLFTRTDPVAIVLVVHGEDPTRVLLVRKPNYVPRTRHTCVAGFIEPGESAEEGAAREVKEETNVDVDPASVRFVASQPWPSNIGSQLMLGFMCRARKDTAPVRADGDELDDARWYTVDEVRAALRSPDPAAEPEFSVPGPHALANKMMAHWVQLMDAGTLKW